MIHGHDDRMERIEKFFCEHSLSELEDFLIQSGAGTIKDSRESHYVEAICRDVYDYKQYISSDNIDFKEYSVNGKVAEGMKGAA